MTTGVSLRPKTSHQNRRSPLLFKKHRQRPTFIDEKVKDVMRDLFIYKLFSPHYNHLAIRHYHLCLLFMYNSFGNVY